MTRKYTAGSVITVRVQLTANHRGYFLFKLCPATSNKVEVTQECLDRYPLEVVGAAGHRDPDGFKYYVPSARPEFFETQLRLPRHLTCDRCVLQWHYSAGNNWGRCDDGKRFAVGCGPQETFRGCADIKIVDGAGGGGGSVDDENDIDGDFQGEVEDDFENEIEPSPVGSVTNATRVTPKWAPSSVATRRISVTPSTPFSVSTKPPTKTTNDWCPSKGVPTKPPRATAKPSNPRPNSRIPFWPPRPRFGPKPTRKPPTTTLRALPSQTRTKVVPKYTRPHREEMTSPASVGRKKPKNACVAVGVWARMANMDNWCATNCAAGFCPGSHCQCR